MSTQACTVGTCLTSNSPSRPWHLSAIPVRVLSRGKRVAFPLADEGSVMLLRHRPGVSGQQCSVYREARGGRTWAKTSSSGVLLSAKAARWSMCLRLLGWTYYLCCSRVNEWWCRKLHNADVHSLKARLGRDGQRSEISMWKRHSST